MRQIFTWYIIMGSMAYAELPQNLDQVLFGICGGTSYTDYVKWIKSEGTIVFHRPFVIFDRAQFKMHYPTNDFAPRHYSIEMEREFTNTSNSTNLVNCVQKAEDILLDSFKGQIFKRQYDGVHYQSSCADIDGLGWDACFYVMPLQRNGKILYVAKAKFYNSLHRAEQFMSCEDFNLSNNDTTSSCHKIDKIEQVAFSEPLIIVSSCPGIRYPLLHEGTVGAGEFLGFSFGASNKNINASNFETNGDSLVVFKSLENPYMEWFDRVSLWHNQDHRLYRIDVQGQTPEDFSARQRYVFYNALTNDLGKGFGVSLTRLPYRPDMPYDATGRVAHLQFHVNIGRKNCRMSIVSHAPFKKSERGSVTLSDGMIKINAEDL